MTPRDTALRLMRQRGTSTGHPAFIAAYLQAELDRDPLAFLAPRERMRAENYARMKTQLRAIGYVFQTASQAVDTSAKSLRRAAEVISQAGHQQAQQDYTLAQ